MARKKTDNVELLLSKLYKKQLADFIRKECVNGNQLRDCFLALGAGTLFKPKSQTYTSQVEDYAGRHGYIEYHATFDFNRAVCRILDEAADAMANRLWEVATAVLSGITAAGDDIAEESLWQPLSGVSTCHCREDGFADRTDRGITSLS